MSVGEPPSGKAGPMAEDRLTIDEMLERARTRLRRVDVAEAADAVRKGDAVLVDIRSDNQRAADGTVPEAIHHPRNVLEWRADPASGASDPRLASDLDRQVIVMCDAGWASSLAAETLQQLGFAQATDLVGGFQAWRDAGLPVDEPPA